MADLVKQKIIVVLGPTASGKTALAIQLARQFNGEIISADSMQIYKGLDIGTAKASAEEQSMVKHHLIDIAHPQEPFSVAAFLPLAQQKIDEITKKGRLPIFCGGTGLYLSSLVNGISFTEEKSDPKIREELQNRLTQEGAAAMLQELQKVDPAYAAKLHENDTKRVLRALELNRKTGLTMSQQIARSQPPEPPYDALLLGLDLPDRNELYNRINARVDQMISDGVVEEARQVYLFRESWICAAQAIGYKEFFPYFEGVQSLEDCVQKLKQSTRNYAKRQLSWFRHMPNVIWLNAAQPDAQQIVEDFLKEDL